MLKFICKPKDKMSNIELKKSNLQTVYQFNFVYICNYFIHIVIFLYKQLYWYIRNYFIYNIYNNNYNNI